MADTRFTEAVALLRKAVAFGSFDDGTWWDGRAEALEFLREVDTEDNVVLDGLIAEKRMELGEV